MLFFVILSVWYALKVEGIIIDNYFVSIPSLGIVLAFSGLTYAKKDKYKFHQLGKVLKKDLILGGWIGTMIGIMLTFGLADNSVNNNFGDLLNSIGFYWDVFEDEWMENFEKLKDHFSNFGYSIPASNDKLRSWVGKQRLDFKKNKLSNHKKNLLEKIGFSWDVAEDALANALDKFA